MNKKLQTAIVALGVVLFVVGIVLLFRAPHIGVYMANQAIYAHHGTINTDEYDFIMKYTAISYQVGGAVISLAGGTCALLFGSRR